MPASRFPIEITATDKTQAALRSVESNFAKLTKGTALQGVSDRLGGINKKAQAFKDFGKSLANLGDMARLSSGGVGEAAESIEGMGAAAGLAGMAIGGTVLGLAAAGVAAAKFEMDYSRAGAAIGRTSQVIGVSAQQLQAYQIAGEKAGVSAEQMTSAFNGLGSTLNDALAGRNQTAMVLLQRLGITIHRTASGAIDTARAMDDLGGALQRQSPQTREFIAAQFGASGALQFLMQTQAERERQLDDAYRSGAIRTDGQIAQETRLQKSAAQLSDRWHALLNTLSTKLIVPWLAPLEDALTALLGGAEHLIGAGAAPAAAGAGAGPAAPRAAAARQTGRGGGLSTADAVAYFVAQGWSPAQAAGIVANLQKESGLNAGAVGDQGRAYGLGQWHPDRQADFARWSGHGIQGSSAQEQLAFVQYELTQGRRRGAGDQLRRLASAFDAGSAVSRLYEAPRDTRGEAAARGAAADAIMKGQVHVAVDIRGAPPGSTAIAQASGGGVTTSARIAPSMAGASI